MYVCMYVYMYVCMYVCMFACMYSYVYVCVCMYVYQCLFDLAYIRVIFITNKKNKINRSYNYENFVRGKLYYSAKCIQQMIS